MRAVASCPAPSLPKTTAKLEYPEEIVDLDNDDKKIVQFVSGMIRHAVLRQALASGAVVPPSEVGQKICADQALTVATEYPGPDAGPMVGSTDRLADVIAERVVERLRGEEPRIAEPEAVFLSVDEAARLMGITRDAMDKRIQRRQVPGVLRTAGRRVQIDRARLLAGLARRTR